MKATAPEPTVDEAMSELQALLRAAPPPAGAPATAARPQTQEEAEEARFRLAETVLRLACPQPADCSDPHCRRSARCRHLERIAAKRAAGKASHPRRTPGAEAVRYAVWVLMSSR
jgi:hypothetical protein